MAGAWCASETRERVCRRAGCMSSVWEMVHESGRGRRGRRDHIHSPKDSTGKEANAVCGGI